ncbi:hypothetical protein EYF80_004966 [Liparis tanakae]|uniref:Uncharacterized protein n=1 Tax=Liparis tanakae TaxID=230148 RepID=A0A4Z2J4P8_9TELE|nr:hypothetical protein EYF80_004966 [Liparis tanakae]
MSGVGGSRLPTGALKNSKNLFSVSPALQTNDADDSSGTKWDRRPSDASYVEQRRKLPEMMDTYITFDKSPGCAHTLSSPR